MSTTQELVKKWKPILEHASLPKIGDRQRLEDTAVLLENQERANREERAALFEDAPGNSAGAMPDSGGVAKFDPVLISLVRRAVPAMVAYDICGVQPMTQPTGLIFAMKSKYSTQGGTEALFNEADTDFGGTGTHAGDPEVSGSTTGTGMTTAAGETLGSTNGTPGATFNQMAFSIEKTSVVAVTRALKAEYSVELAQDLKAVHGLDADSELSNILSIEITNEINREVVRTIYKAAKVGAQVGTAVAGSFDLDIDSNGRWSVEKFKGLMFQIEREANAIYQQTRRGKGNIIVCSADVASALQMAGVLDYTPALAQNQLVVDESVSTFAGILNGRYRVYVDPFAANGAAEQFLMVGYKGVSRFDAGAFYCPYVPLQMYRATDPNTFQPKLAYRTRYGFVANPFTSLSADSNIYYRRVKVLNIA